MYKMPFSLDWVEAEKKLKCTMCLARGEIKMELVLGKLKHYKGNVKFCSARRYDGMQFLILCSFIIKNINSKSFAWKVD